MTADERLAALLGEVHGPMWILTVAVDGERSGCLVGFATQVSIEPARFLACVSRANHTFDPAMRADHVAVHVAPEGDLASLFGEETGDEIDKFTRCDWHDGPAGQPVLDGVPGWFVGHVLARHDLGDHVGLLLEPVAVAGRADDALDLQDAQELDAGHPG